MTVGQFFRVSAAHLSVHGVAPGDNATVYIVDDDPDVRRSVALLVRSTGMNAVSFASAPEFLDKFDRPGPCCLVLDILLPGMTGLELQRILNANGTCLPVVFITAHGEVPAAISAIRAGAVDFIAKPCNPQVLLNAIRQAIELDKKYLEDTRFKQDIIARIGTLTNRQREVMQLLAAGEMTKVIAKRLKISPKTVDNHRAKILEKMAVNNPTQLANLLLHIDAPSQRTPPGPTSVHSPESKSRP